MHFGVPANFPSRDEATRRRIAIWIMIGLAAWGSLLALGAVLNYPVHRDWRRAAVVLACVAGFIAAWWLLMLFGRRRARRQRDRAGGEPPAT
jgi:Na+-driven multidrug efflux pump